jgi:hypothetical protein
MKSFKTLIAVLSAIILVAAGCSKKEALQEIQKPKEVAFNFIQNEIRDTAYENPEKTKLALMKWKNKRPEAMENATPENPFIIFVSIKGDTVTNANWYGGNTFIVTMADTNTINQALETTKKMYSMFKNVIVTTNIALWQAAGPENRVKVIVGNCDVLGPYLGYAWVNCYLWQDDTPAFVLVNKCNPLTLLADIAKKCKIGLDMIGDDTITGEPELAHLIKTECNLTPRLRYIGPQTREQCVLWFNTNKALLHPNLRYREPFGLAPVEAQACGMPVIAWNYGAMSETILNNETGFLVNSQEEIVINCFC